MEENLNTAITNGENKMTMDVEKSLPYAFKKKRGPMHLIRVALYMLRKKSGKSKASMQVDVASKGPWKEVLGSMRPLHLQSNQSPPTPSQETPKALPTIEQFEETFSPPVSPSAAKSIASSSSVGDMSSKYSSALNLQELDTCEDNNEDYDDNGGDKMIDLKAEEFINQFYNQMKIQNSEYMNKSRQKLKQAS